MLFFIIYYAFVNPKVEAQKQRINIMLQNEQQTVGFKQEIIGLKATIEKLQPEYDKKRNYFTVKKKLKVFTKI